MLKLAARNLRRNRRRTAIALMALVLGVSVLLVLRGFINGQQRVILENMIEGRLGVVQVHRHGYTQNILTSPLTLDMADTPELRKTLASPKGVTAVAPRIDFGAMVSTPDRAPAPSDGSALPEAEQGKTSFFIATAIEPGSEEKVTPIRHRLVTEGRDFVDSGAGEVVLNAEFAKGLEAKLHRAGEPLPPIEQQAALLAGDRDAALNGENVVLIGTFPAFAPGDKRVGLVPLKTAQRLLRMEGRVTEYALAVEPWSRAAQVRDELRAKLGPEYDVDTWYELFPFVTTLTSTQDFLFGIVMAVFLVVVLLGIVNAMLMTVLERVREIGTMLAVGMRRRQIVQLFLLEGAVLGVLGGAIGLILGLAGTWFLYQHGIPLPAPGATVPSIIRPTLTLPFVMAVVVGAPLGASLGALWPAWRASRLRPVEALHSV